MSLYIAIDYSNNWTVLLYGRNLEQPQDFVTASWSDKEYTEPHIAPLTRALQNWTEAFYLQARAKTSASLNHQVSPRIGCIDQSLPELPDQVLIECLENYLPSLRTYINAVSFDTLSEHNLGDISDLNPFYLLTVPAIWTDKLRNDVCNTLNKNIDNEKLITITNPKAAIFYAAAKKKIELQDEECVTVCDITGPVVLSQL